MSRLGGCTLCAAIAVGLASPARGEAIETGLYRLHNHPDGHVAPPLYGLRLDELFDVTPGDDYFTFDFDHPDAAMYLEFEGSTIHIYGTAFGGRQDGSGYDAGYTSMVEVDFTYAAVSLAPNDDDLLVAIPDSTDLGSITWLATGQEFGLWNHNNADGYSFRFGDGPENLGHRGFPGISGWGWLEHTMPGSYISASDWLFTAERIPAPPALAVIGLGLLLGRVRHRR